MSNQVSIFQSFKIDFYQICLCISIFTSSQNAYTIFKSCIIIIIFVIGRNRKKERKFPQLHLFELSFAPPHLIFSESSEVHCSFRTQSYKINLVKQYQSQILIHIVRCFFLVNYDHFLNLASFLGSSGSSKNCLQPQTKI